MTTDPRPDFGALLDVFAARWLQGNGHFAQEARARVVALYEAAVKERDDLKAKYEGACMLAATNQRDALEWRDLQRRKALEPRVRQALGLSERAAK